MIEHFVNNFKNKLGKKKEIYHSTFNNNNLLLDIYFMRKLITYYLISQTFKANH